MADSKMTKLSQLPWPVWVGASLALHVGALAVGLPTILRVDPPPSSSIDIPVTLVDEGSLPATAPQPPIPTTSVPKESVTQSNPLGGQNPTVAPQIRPQVVKQQEAPQTITPKQPEPTLPVDTPLPEKPVTKPTNEVETPDDVDIPDDFTTETPAATDEPASADEDNQNSESDVGNGAILISIAGTPTVPKGTPGDWPDILPVLQSTSTLSVANHDCNAAIPAGDVTVGALIGADGSVIEVFVPSGGDSVAAPIASCLLIHVLHANPAAIRFSPAYTGDQAVITDRVRLTLRFSAG